MPADLSAIDKAKFRRPVFPGDQVRFHVRKQRARGRAWKFFAEAKVDDQVVAEAEVMAMIVDTPETQAMLAKHSGSGG